MANGTSTEDFVVLSRVRTGLKREFEFALKVQSEISGLGRTRSRRPQNGLAGTPENPRKKRMKSSVSKGTKVEKNKDKDRQEEKSVRVVDDSVDLMSEGEAKSDVVDVDEPKGQTEVPVCESKMGESGTGEDGVVEPMCEHETSKDEEGKVHAVYFEEKEEDGVRNSKIGLAEDENDPEKVSVMDSEKIVCEEKLKKKDEDENALVGVEDDLLQEDSRENQPKAAEEDNAKDPEKESPPEGLLISAEEKGKSDLEIKISEEKNKLDQVGSSQNMPVLVNGDSNRNAENLVMEDKPLRRFTRSLLKQKVDTVTKTAPGDMEEPAVKNGADWKREEVGGKRGEKESEPESLSVIGEEKGKSDLEITFTPETRDLNEEGLHQKMPILISGNGDCYIENMVLEEKPLRRFTRSLLKPKLETVKTAAEDVVEETNVRNGADSKVAGQLTPIQQEKKVSTKTLRAIPTKLKGFLDCGILEGLRVEYVRSSKGAKGSGVTGLQGVIKGSGILCFCGSCKGEMIVPPTVYELHAGSANKHPAEYIYLENGRTLRDVMNLFKSNSLATLEESLCVGIGSSMKKSKFCLNCEGSTTGCVSCKSLIFCDSCLESSNSEASSIETFDETNSSRQTSSNLSTPVDRVPSQLKCSSSQTKVHGRVTRKDLRMHKLVFEEDGLPEGTELAYFVCGQKMLVGYKRGFGILCTCCKAEISPSQFEAHAGYASRRKPFQHIYMSNGVSLHELSISLSKDRKFSTNENDDLCSICLDGGNLLCCDTCPRAFHKDCVSLPAIPTGSWYCRYCQNTFQKEKFVERNANALAAGRVAGVDPIEQITKRCIRIVETPVSEVVSVCVLCRGHTFSKFGFGPRTVILCDQCEKEYHVGCLRDHNMDDLKELPEGKWFCSGQCCKIHSTLQKLLVRGEEKLPDTSLYVLKKKHEEHLPEDRPNLDISWRVLSGKMASYDDTRVLLSKAVAIFHDCFDPISESGSLKGDLIPSMVYGRAVKGQDFGGMYCAILSVNQVVVSAGIFRIFGPEVAELPLVATSTECQGQGYFQCLFSCIEKLLAFLNVRHLVLPAADEAESIWTSKFGFGKMTEDELSIYRRDYQMMVFQGTSMLRKAVPEIQLVGKPEDG